MSKSEKNSCYTYFKITGNFDPDEISNMLSLVPVDKWKIGDLRKYGNSSYDFALWNGQCDKYDVCVENQMLETIKDLIPKTDILKTIKKTFDVYFTLQVVPTVYVNESTPCLAPNREIIEFLYETETGMDIDLYVYK